MFKSTFDGSGVPRVRMRIIRKIPPATNIGAILIYWAIFNWIPWIVKPFGINMSIEWAKVFPWISITQTACDINLLILFTRFGLLILLFLLLAMIFVAWELKKYKGDEK